jgi:hypothetical protein
VVERHERVRRYEERWFHKMQVPRPKSERYGVAARHAVAIDEQRDSFSPTLWQNFEDLNASLGFASTDHAAPYQQKWFTGVHGSVGGGGDVRGLSDYALQWIPGPTGSWDERKDFSDWRANVTSRGRALLMLFLFSDVGECDAPTRIKVGSHLDIARFLESAGEQGMSHAELDIFAATLERPEALATGEAGDVYLCHPFLVHAAQMHRGSMPRVLRNRRSILLSRSGSIGRTATIRWLR